MTGISKEAVERLIWRTQIGQPFYADDHNAMHETLRALQARVEELEATVRDCEDDAFRLEGLYSQAVKDGIDNEDLAHENGRLQGLDKALAVTIPSTSWGTEGLPQQYAEAIEALKGPTS